MDPVRLDHLNLSVQNFHQSAEWYGRLFGFEIVEQGKYGGAPWGVLRSGDTMLCIYEESERVDVDEHEEDDRFHRIYHFGLRLKDEPAFAERVKALEIETFYDSPVRYPYSKSWYVKDPTGHTIEVAFWKNDTVRF